MINFLSLRKPHFLLLAISLVLGTVGLSGCGQTSPTADSTSGYGPSPTQSSTLDKITSADKVVIGIKTDYAPFGFIDKDGKNAGLEIDIARQIGQSLLGSEDKVEFVPVVAANRIDFLKQGKVDVVIATMTDTEERRKVIDFSAGTGLLTRKDSGISQWEDLKGKTVCGIQGSFYNKELSERGITMSNFPGTAEAYKALQEGRCIGFAYDDSALVGKLLEADWAKDWHSPLPSILPQPWGIGVRKGDNKFLARLNEIILKMEADGMIVAEEKKWQIPPTEYAQQRQERAQKLLKTGDVPTEPSN